MDFAINFLLDDTDELVGSNDALSLHIFANQLGKLVKKRTRPSADGSLSADGRLRVNTDTGVDG